jgi:tRNA threonylcarbamoyladenosine biosynthesis protein TsaE
MFSIKQKCKSKNMLYYERMQFNFSEIQNIAKDVLKKLVEKNTNIIALYGDLGAGKTTLVSAIAKELDVAESIISPTFIIYRTYSISAEAELMRNKYGAKLNAFSRLVHIDAYRLTGEEDAKKVRLDELFAAPANLVCIEWPKHVGALLSTNALHVHLTYTGEHEREIEIR